jgi:hypothetical protein
MMKKPMVKYRKGEVSRVNPEPPIACGKRNGASGRQRKRDDLRRRLDRADAVELQPCSTTDGIKFSQVMATTSPSAMIAWRAPDGREHQRRQRQR